MKTFQVTGPDGRTFDITAPDGATLNDAMAYAKTTYYSGAPTAAPVPPEPEDQSVFRSIADVPLSAAKGVTTGVGSIADAMGANNEVSQAIYGAGSYLDSLLSAGAKQDQQEVARIMQEAQDKGAWEQVKAGLNALKVAPIDLVSNVLGTAAPVVIATLLSGAAALPVAVGLGVTTGVGIVKNTIYNSVLEEAKKVGVPEDQAIKAADAAQSYTGDNAGLIVGGGLLGAIASATGLEATALRAIQAGVVKKVSKELAETAVKPVAEEVVKGVPRRFVEGFAKESITEAGQAGQEQLAGNVAAQRAGFNVPTMRGVVGAATLEGLAGGVVGGGADVFLNSSPAPDEAKNALNKFTEEIGYDPGSDEAGTFENLKLDAESLGILVTPEDNIDTLEQKIQAKELENTVGREKLSVRAEANGIPIDKNDTEEVIVAKLAATSTKGTTPVRLIPEQLREAARVSGINIGKNDTLEDVVNNLAASSVLKPVRADIPTPAATATPVVSVDQPVTSDKLEEEEEEELFTQGGDDSNAAQEGFVEEDTTTPTATKVAEPVLTTTEPTATTAPSIIPNETPEEEIARGLKEAEESQGFSGAAYDEATLIYSQGSPEEIEAYEKKRRLAGTEQLFGDLGIPLTTPMWRRLQSSLVGNLNDETDTELHKKLIEYKERSGVLPEAKANIEKWLTKYFRVPIEYEDVTPDGRAWARYNKKTGVVTINPKELEKRYNDKAWTKPKKEGVTPLPEDTFKTLQEWRDFIVAHENTHAIILQNKGESLGDYENRINAAALDQIGKPAPVDLAKAPDAQQTATPEFDKLPSYKPGQRTMRYAGIGSRETPENVLVAMTKAAGRLAALGYTLQSGAAGGADTAFEAGAGASKQIFTTRDATDTTRAIAKEIHPNPAALKPYPLNLMARNTNQIFGENLDSPVDFVLAWTPDGAESSADRSIKTGGTGQAIDMASRKGIPVINMAIPGWGLRVKAILDAKQSTPTQEKDTTTPTATTPAADRQPVEPTPAAVTDLLTNLEKGGFDRQPEVVEERKQLKQQRDDAFDIATRKGLSEREAARAAEAVGKQGLPETIEAPAVKQKPTTLSKAMRFLEKPFTQKPQKTTQSYNDDLGLDQTPQDTSGDVDQDDLSSEDYESLMQDIHPIETERAENIDDLASEEDYELYGSALDADYKGPQQPKKKRRTFKNEQRKRDSLIKVVSDKLLAAQLELKNPKTEATRKKVLSTYIKELEKNLANLKAPTAEEFLAQQPSTLPTVDIVPMKFGAQPAPGVVDGHRYKGKNILNATPGERGWLGNPYAADDTPGGKLTREEVTAKYKESLYARAKEDPKFAKALRGLRGKAIGYYKPNEEFIHLQAVQQWLQEDSKKNLSEKLEVDTPAYGDYYRTIPGNIENLVSNLVNALSERYAMASIYSASGGRESIIPTVEKHVREKATELLANNEFIPDVTLDSITNYIYRRLQHIANVLRTAAVRGNPKRALNIQRVGTNINQMELDLRLPEKPKDDTSSTTAKVANVLRTTATRGNPDNNVFQSDFLTDEAFKNATTELLEQDLASIEEIIIAKAMADSSPDIDIVYSPVYDAPPLNSDGIVLVAEGKLDKVIGHLINNTKNPVVRRALISITGLNLKTKLVVGPSADSEFGGEYDAANDTITVDPTQINEPVLVHEIIHAGISHVLSNPNHPLTKELTRLFKLVKSKLGDRYGTKNVDEFASELIANEEFQQEIKDLKDNIFTRIMRAITQFLFSIPPKASIFDQAVDTVTDIISISDQVLRKDNEFGKRGQLNPNAPGVNKKIAKIADITATADEIVDGSGALYTVTQALLKNDYSKLSSMFGTVMNKAQRAAFMHALTTRGLFGVAKKLKISALAAVENLLLRKLPGLRNDMRKLDDRFIDLILKWGAKNGKNLVRLGIATNAARMFQINPRGVDLTTAIENDATVAYYDSRIKDPSYRNNKSHNQKRKAARIKEINYVYQAYEALGVEGQNIFTRMNETYKKQLTDYEATIRENVSAILENVKANKKQTEEEALKEKEDLEAALSPIFRALFSEVHKVGVYFPLGRHGNFWVRVGKGKNGETQFFDSEVARDIYIKSVRSRYASDPNKTPPITKGSHPDELQGELFSGDNKIGTTLLLKQLFDKIDVLPGTLSIDPSTGGIDINAAIVGDLKNSILDMYLRSLPGADLRKRYMHSTMKAGFSSDVLRTFINYSFRHSNQLPRLKYAQQIASQLSAAKDSAEGMPDDEAGRIQDLVLAIRDRAMPELDPQDSDTLGDFIAQQANQATFLYTMTSLRTALVALTQLPVFGTPKLAANYGLANTTRMIAKYTGSIFAGNTFSMKDVHTDLNGNITHDWVMPNMAGAAAFKNNPRLVDAYETALSWGTFVNGFGSEFQAAGERPTRKQFTLVTRGKKLAMTFMTGAFKTTERMSREIMFMSTYELAFDKATQEGLNEGDAHTRAINEADEFTNQTMFDYSRANKQPFLYRTPEARVLFQFMTFPINVAGFMVRNAATLLSAVKEKDPAMAKAAAVEFFGTMGCVFMFSGVTGLPFYSLIMGVMEALRDQLFDFEEYDDKTDPRSNVPLPIWFTETYLPRIFGGGASVVQSGPISALLDINIGSSVGLNNLFFKDEVLADGAKDWVQKFMLGVFSPPSISVAGQFASGVDLMYEGQFLRGAERIIPAQFRGLAVALRLGKEGSETPTGMRLLDPEFYTTGKLIAQGIGFKTVTEEQISKANFAAKGYENKLEIERNQFLKRLNNAYRAIEKADSKDVDSLWLKFDGIVDEMIKFSIVNPVSAFTSEGINTSLRSKVEAREKSKYTKGLSTSSDKKLDLLMQLLNREYE